MQTRRCLIVIIASLFVSFHASAAATEEESVFKQHCGDRSCAPSSSNTSSECRAMRRLSQAEGDLCDKEREEGKKCLSATHFIEATFSCCVVEAFVANEFCWHTGTALLLRIPSG